MLSALLGALLAFKVFRALALQGSLGGVLGSLGPGLTL